MKTLSARLASCAAATLITTSVTTLPATADSSALCAKGDTSNCYLAGNFPPHIAQGFGITDESSLVVRFVDGQWSMGGHVIGSFSAAGWTPVVGDWDGDGYDNVGVYRNGTWVLKTSWNFVNPAGDVEVHTLGNPNAIPIPGDWNNNGTDSIGVYEDGTFTLWLDSNTASTERVISFGNLPYDAVDSLSARPAAGSFGGQGDLVGIVEGHDAKYASTVISATYDFHNPTGGLLALNEGTVANRYSGLFPIVVDGHDPHNPAQQGPRLLFSKLPADTNDTVCPTPTAIDPSCKWLVTKLSEIKPDQGGRTDIPDPEVW